MKLYLNWLPSAAELGSDSTRMEIQSTGSLRAQGALSTMSSGALQLPFNPETLFVLHTQYNGDVEK